jgi:hypothetical protein
VVAFPCRPSCMTQAPVAALWPQFPQGDEEESSLASSLCVVRCGP